ncbi:MAG TPA: hypothetical protein VFB58_13765 [Chloroflexota bacterium]|nr:hypothetical protein [Chloroflexota bacterium]
MNQTLIFGIALVPAIVGLTEVTKQLGLSSRFAPAMAVAFGILGSLAQLYGGHVTWMPAVVTGIALGLSASGLYSGARTLASSDTGVGATLREFVPATGPVTPAPVTPVPAMPAVPARPVPVTPTTPSATLVPVSTTSSTHDAPPLPLTAPTDETNGPQGA